MSITLNFVLLMIYRLSVKRYDGYLVHEDIGNMFITVLAALNSFCLIVLRVVRIPISVHILFFYLWLRFVSVQLSGFEDDPNSPLRGIEFQYTEIKIIWSLFLLEGFHI